MSDIIGLIVLSSCFVIVLVVCLSALKLSMFGDGSRIAISIAVALLSCLGLARMFGTHQRSEGGLDFILIPYAAMAIALVVLFLIAKLWPFSTDLGNRRDESEGDRRQAQKSRLRHQGRDDVVRGHHRDGRMERNEPRRFE